MYKIPQALGRLAKELGISIICNAEVKEFVYDRDKISSVILADGKTLPADVFVINADLPFAYKSLLKQEHPKQKNFKYSCGAYLLYLGIDTIPDDFYHHQCFIPASFQCSMEEIFQKGKVPEDPAFYTCCPTITDSSLAPEGKHCLTVLVPVPSEPSQLDWSFESKKLQTKIFDKLSKSGVNKEAILVSQQMTPSEMGVKFNLDQNAAFGLSHKLSQMGPLRPKNKHESYRNLYFAGASTHPGNGIPMVIKSGKLTAQRILEEQAVSSRQ